MEDKENSGGSVNTSSSDAERGSVGRTFDNLKASRDNGNDDSQKECEDENMSTQDLSLHLELDESASFRETQEQTYEFPPMASKNAEPCDDETQEYQRCKTMDSLSQSQDEETEFSMTKAVGVSDLRTGGTKKRYSDSQGNLV